MATATDRLAAKVARLDALVRGLATGPQMGYSSLEDARIEEYDGNGQLVSIVGKQPDGTHGAVVVSGPNPPRPSAAVASGGPGLLSFGWDGNFADEVSGETDITIPAPLDWGRMEAHASPISGYQAETTATLLDTMESPRGGSRTAMLDPGVWYVVLVSRALSGKRSTQSVEVAVEVLAPVGSDIDIDALRDEFRAVDAEMNAAIQQNKQAQKTLAGTVAGLRDITLPALDRDLALAEERLASAQTAIDTVIPSQINAAKQAAITAAATDAKAQADAAKASATTAAAADAKTKADAAQAAALAAAKTYAEAQASGAGDAALAAAKTDATTKANAAKDAATAAAALDAQARADKALADAALDAKAKADKALADAKADAANQVQVVVNSIMGQTYYGTAAPSATVPGGTIKPGSTYRRKNASGNIDWEYEYVVTNGTGAWVQRKITSNSMTAVDVGVLTAGSAAILEVVAQKMAAATAAFQTVDIGNLFVTGDSALNTVTAKKIAANIGEFLKVTTDQLVAGSASLGTAVADKFFAEIFATRKLFANQVYVGDSGNLFTGTDFMDAGWANATGISYSETGGKLGGSSMVVAASTAQRGQYFAIAANQQAKLPKAQDLTPYKVGVWVKPAAAVAIGSLSIYFRSYSAAGALLSTSSAINNKVAVAANTWAYLEGIASTPANTARITMGLYTQTTYTGAATFSDPDMALAITPSLIVDGLMNGQRIVGASIETNLDARKGVKLNDDGLAALGRATQRSTTGGIISDNYVRAHVANRRSKWGAGQDGTEWPGLWFESDPVTGTSAKPLWRAGFGANDGEALSVFARSAMKTEQDTYSELVVAPENANLMAYAKGATGSLTRAMSRVGAFITGFAAESQDMGGSLVAGVRHLGDGILRLDGRNGILVNGFSVGEDSGWRNAAYLNGWRDYGNGFGGLQYRKKDGVLYLRGTIKGGAFYTVVAKLPPGFLPTVPEGTEAMEFPISVISGSSYIAGTMFAYANGNLTYYAPVSTWAGADRATLNTAFPQ